MLNCVLCGEPLSLHPTNREHYVPQVLIREFGALGIPSTFDWVVRSNEYSDSVKDSDRISVPVSAHKQWAVVEVHEKCNLDASPMCRDLRYIIDHIDGNIDTKYMERPLEYYAHIWRMNKRDLEFVINTKEDTRKRLSGASMELYRPGLLDCGRIVIRVGKVNGFAEPPNDYEWHTIRLGARTAIDEV